MSLQLGLIKDIGRTSLLLLDQWWGRGPDRVTQIISVRYMSLPEIRNGDFSNEFYRGKMITVEAALLTKHS